MLVFALLAISALTTSQSADSLICEAPGENAFSVQWSESAKHVSPNGEWMIEVRPQIGGKYNDSQVYIEKCGSIYKTTLYKLTRMSELRWSADSKYIAITDYSGAGRGLLRVFSLPGDPYAGVREVSGIDAMAMRGLFERAGSSAKPSFNFKRVTELGSGQLAVIVSGEYTINGQGEMKEYCYEANIDLNNSKLKSATDILDKDFRKSAECAYFP